MLEEPVPTLCEERALRRNDSEASGRVCTLPLPRLCPKLGSADKNPPYPSRVRTR